MNRYSSWLFVCQRGRESYCAPTCLAAALIFGEELKDQSIRSSTGQLQGERLIDCLQREIESDVRPLELPRSAEEVEWQ